MQVTGSMLNLAAGILLAFAPLHAGQPQSAPGTHSPHGNLNIPCQNCHTTLGWRPIRALPEFDHNQTRYPLRGMHTSVTCSQCHLKPVFNDVGKRCQDCHADIHKRQLGSNCEACHTVRGWQVAVKEIQQHNNRFPLTGAHAAVDCDSCHKGAANSKFQTMSTDCYSCHAGDYKRAKNPDHSKFATTCDTCHSTDNWLNAKFDHSSTGFPLSGGHSVPPRACEDCHVNNIYNLTTTACVSCHLKDFQGTNNPSHVALNFSQTCEQCHNTSTWTNVTFDHSGVGFNLTGLHTVPPRACTDCHTNNNYKLTTGTCVSCHLKDFQGTTNPNHVTANFPQTCENCHNTSSWTNATFDHTNVGFNLTGLHLVPPRACTDCHTNNNYKLTTATCVSCHLKDYQGTTYPNHVTANFPQTCESCHSTSSWTGATFDHSTTGFTLTGLHIVPPRACTDCHINNNYNLTTAACVSCHLKDYQGTNNPNHVTANFPQTCESCHSTSSWTGATFDHTNVGFNLTGLHTVPPRACTDCHTNNNYNLTTAACVSCHLKDYQGTTSPNHVTANFPQTCESCHSTSSWTGATFDHSATGFTLTGLHLVPPRTCTDCHINNNYNLTTASCVSCHLKDYQTTTNPNHVTANFPQTCETCHDTTSWLDSTFNHTTTGFALTGLHLVPPRVCTDCHVNNNYNLTTTACVSCHLKDYQGTNNPNHVTANFPQTCETCHDTTSWLDATFNHTTTGFTLTGLHLVPPRVCTDCHVNNNYNLTTAACVSCHLKDYQGTNNPNHVTANFPQTCETCHDTTTWLDSTFNHSTTGFTLTNSHLVPPRVCTDCHINNNYNLTSTLCVTCHQKDYNNAITPVNHVQANFPTTCEGCHDTIQWTDGKFDHSTTGFTLTNSHLVPPRVCSDCHVNNNYNLNSTLCVTCHQKDYNGATTPVNHVSANFPTTCENCHDTNLWTDGKFDHTATGFTLTGLHLVPPRLCTDCHVNNNYTLNSTLCITCHQTDYNNTTNPGHSAQPQFFPTTCQNCHSTTNWLNAAFNHTQYTQFPISHGNANGVCSTCHINSNDYSIFQCTNCHQKSDTDGNHQGVKGYVYNSINCYQCHKN